MDVTKIPFNKFIGLDKAKTDKDGLVLHVKEDLSNHLGTIHAGAQFSLAEAASGLCLMQNFPDMADSVLPLLRKSEIKFSRPAQSDIRAEANIDAEEKEKFHARFERKGRGVIRVSAEVRDTDNALTMSGTFEWYIQKRS